MIAVTHLKGIKRYVNQRSWYVEMYDTQIVEHRDDGAEVYDDG